MIESELAFNSNGEPFAVPESVTGWRVRRLRGGRGAPELVYGRDGGPLVLGIEAGMDELREAVDVSGRYRLDAVDDDGKAVANVPPSYVQVTIEPRNSSTPGPVATTTALTGTDHVVRELAHANAEMMRQHTALAKEHTELAKAVATQQPELIRAAAEILRAADGAGLPRREPMAYYDEDDEDVDAEQAEPAPPPSFNPIAFMQEIKPLLALFGVDSDKLLAACGVRLPTAAQAKAAHTGNVQVATQPRRAIASAPQKHEPPRTSDEQTTGTSEPEPFVAADPNAHVLAIQAQLAPEERAFVQRAMQQLTPADLIEWRDRLAHMPVEEAVAEIRAEIEKRKQQAEEK